MEPLLKSLFNSILEVSDEYLYWIINDKDNKRNAYVERAFAYELYFRWKIDKTVFHVPMYKKEDKYRVNGEIKKEFAEKVSKKRNYCYPDLVLHGGNDNCENHIVCEIKRKETIDSNKGSLTRDINKLGFFLRDDLHTIYDGLNWKGYKFGVFLLTGKYFEGGNVEVKTTDITENIKLNALRVRKDLRKNIYCAIYNGKKLLYDNLDNIIESLRKNNKTTNKCIVPML